VLNEEEKKIVARWGDGLTAPLTLRLVVSDDPRSRVLGDYAEALSTAAPGVTFRRERFDDDRPPALGVGRNLLFHSAPRGTELAPFLEAAMPRSGAPVPLAPPLQKIADALRTLAHLTLFVADRCPFCPRATAHLLPLSGASRFIRLAVVDAALFDDMATGMAIRSLPTLVLGDTFRWTERFPLEEILATIDRQDPAALGPATLEALLADGNASLVADMMITCGTLFPAFIELLAHDRWPVRLGAMVALETVTLRRPHLAARVVAPLVARFAGAADPVRGDILHVIGETAGRESLRWLSTLQATELHPEVAEAAAEAAAKIAARND